jgi:glucosamine--fructose-6-phosphate aminotransferase (isomerizing)
LTSLLLQEALSAPAAVARLLSRDAAAYRELAAELSGTRPQGLLTLARGSSDHAAQHLAYLVMKRLGLLVTSLPMSLLTLHDAQVAAKGLTAFALSQSGQSPDLVEPARVLRERGARTVCFVNDPGSPLAAACEHVLDLHAGPERSVAATKSFIAQLVAGARLVAAWEGDEALDAALSHLPAALERAAALRWDAALPVLAASEHLYVVGRGLGLAVAQEAALKFKETCGIQAEAFSGAELHHGPMALVGAGWPLLVLAPPGPAQAGLLDLAARVHERGAQVLLALPHAQRGMAAAAGAIAMPLAASGHGDLDAITLAQTLYPFVDALARERGRDPDAPPGLAKVTRTR